MYVRCIACGWIDCDRCDALGRIPGLPTSIDRGRCRRCGNPIAQTTLVSDVESVKHKRDCPNKEDFMGIAQADPTNIAYRG